MAFGITLNDIPCNFAQCNSFTSASFFGATQVSVGDASGFGSPRLTFPPVTFDFVVAWTAQPSRSVRFDFDTTWPITGLTANDVSRYGTASVVNKAQGAFQVGWDSPILGSKVLVTPRLLAVNLNFNFTEAYTPPSSHNVNFDFVSDVNVGISGTSVPVSLGAVTIGLTAAVTPAGVQLSTALGSVGVRLSPNVQVSGVQTNVELGTPLVRGDANVAVTGVQVGVALGTVSTRVDMFAYPSGVQTNVGLGDPALTYDYAFTPDGVRLPITLGTARGLPNTEARPTGVALTVHVRAPRITGAIDLKTLVPEPERHLFVLKDVRLSQVKKDDRLLRVTDDPRVSDVLPDIRTSKVPAEDRLGGVPLSDRSLILPA